MDSIYEDDRKPGVKSILVVSLFVLLAGVASSPIASSTATTLNGTYEGFHVAESAQNLFLGLLYANGHCLQNPEPHQGGRFVDGCRRCQHYTVVCYAGYYPGTVGTVGATAGEDCTSLNIIRTAGATSSLKPPAMVRIHGSGFVVGTNDEDLVTAGSLAAFLKPRPMPAALLLRLQFPSVRESTNTRRSWPRIRGCPPHPPNSLLVSPDPAGDVFCAALREAKVTCGAQYHMMASIYIDYAQVGSQRLMAGAYSYHLDTNPTDISHH
ncbi:putative lipase [Colletotrichum sublineola]|uniref:Putative lipase n=1 Tax=Colletotrichum sublineola TaxID=1173701 RepID=A0A066XMV1_COLSU|nr:putative lipase [Colletotrichum sublineola]